MLALVAVTTVGLSAQAASASAPATLWARLASAARVAEGVAGGGYWIAWSDGHVYAYGTAHFYGSMSGRHLNAPITGILATADGHGYWLVGKDGAVFSFGDAGFAGSMGGTS